MTKNILKKFAPAAIGLSVLLVTATSFVPVASANNGLHLGLDLGMGHKMEKGDQQVSADVKAFMSNTSVKTARQTYKTSVKQANTTYQAAVKTARDKFSASLKTATDFNAKVAAWKVYMGEKLAAWKAKNVAVEAAFQTFINTNFTDTTPNQVPVANELHVTLNKNTASAVTLTGSDPENHALTFTVVGNPSHGTLSGTAPALTYTPTANFSGSDTFTFKVNDSTQDSSLKTVFITVNP